MADKDCPDFILDEIDWNWDYPDFHFLWIDDGQDFPIPPLAG
jgi:hypothetical protein